MGDETRDMSIREQVVICLRLVDNDLLTHENLISVHTVDCTNVATLESVITEVLVRMNLSIQKCRELCYTICSVMVICKCDVNHVLED